MKVRAVAAPSPDSNAIGSVELECSPQGLSMLYLGVGAYSDGYAPGALTSGTRVFAPWEQVEEVRVFGEHVSIRVAESLTPHNKMSLTHFTDGTVQARDGLNPELKRRQQIVRAAAIALTLTVCVSLAFQLPHWSADIGQLGALIIGCVSGLFILLLGLFAEFLLLPRPLSSFDAQRLFVADLAHYRPEPVREGPGPLLPVQRFEFSELIRMPRSSLGIIIVFTAGSLAAILTSSWVLQDDKRSPRVARESQEQAAPDRDVAPVAILPHPARSEPAVAAMLHPSARTTQIQVATEAPTSAPPGTGAVLGPGAPCVCRRSDSALYQVAFPKQSTLLIAQSSRAHKDHFHLELELGVVNNSKEVLDEVNLLVNFYEQEGKKPTKDRPLHYGSALVPGQAVKWHVEARGTSFLVHNPVTAVLDPAAGELAPADAFAELLNANHRPVRLHGAMMLAFLGDERAKAGAVSLREALRENEAPYLERLMMALGDLASCNWQVSETGRLRQVNACVYNRSSVRQQDLAIKVRALDRVFDHRSPVAEPPQVIAEKVWRLEGAYEPGTGRVVGVEFDTDNSDGKIPKAFEVFADRADLLY